MEKIKLEDFVVEFKTLEDVDEKSLGRALDKILDKVFDGATEYVPYTTKWNEALKIAKATMEDKESGLIKMCTPARFMLSSMWLISTYTNLDVRLDENMYDDYDLLKECGAFNAIMKGIDQSEYEEFNTLLSMCVEDTMTNKYDSHRYVMEVVGSIADKLVKVTEPMVPVLEKLNDEVQKLDKDQSKKLGEAIVKKFVK